MAAISFFEKPGCINNTRQKKLLALAGHTLQVHNLLDYPWRAEELRRYFGDLPVAQWFNPSAPAVKAGQVTPEAVTEHEALELMLQDPLLIRRPLMQVGEECRVGFDIDTVHQWIGLDLREAGTGTRQDLETCPQQRET